MMAEGYWLACDVHIKQDGGPDAFSVHRLD
jgi:hypothetical protein